jgi:hypothetical protein
MASKRLPVSLKEEVMARWIVAVKGTGEQVYQYLTTEFGGHRNYHGQWTVGHGPHPIIVALMDHHGIERPRYWRCAEITVDPDPGTFLFLKQMPQDRNRLLYGFPRAEYEGVLQRIAAARAQIEAQAVQELAQRV